MQCEFIPNKCNLFTQRTVSTVNNKMSHLTVTQHCIEPGHIYSPSW